MPLVTQTLLLPETLKAGVCLRPVLGAAERWEQRLGHLCTGRRHWASRSLVKASAGRSAPLCAALGPEVLPETHTRDEILFLEKQSAAVGVWLVRPGAGLPWRMDAFPGAGAAGLALPSGWMF